MKSWSASLLFMTRSMRSARGTWGLRLRSESLAKGRGIPGAAAQYVAASYRAPLRRHGRKTLAWLRAQVHRNARRRGCHNRTVRRAANWTWSAVRIFGRLADRPMGTAPRVAGLQRGIRRGLRRGADLAALAGTVARVAFVSRVERPVAACDIHHYRYFPSARAPYHGRGRAIHGSSYPDDAGSADGGLAGHTFRLGGRGEIRPGVVHRAEPANGPFSM